MISKSQLYSDVVRCFSGIWDQGVREPEVPWQTMSVGVFSRRSLLKEVRSMNKLRTRERICIIANKNKRLLIKENVFLNLFAMIFEELN